MQQVLTQTTSHRNLARKLVSLLLVPFIVVGFVLCLVIFSILFYQINYQDRVFPGVHVWGMDLSGMTRDEAATSISNAFDYPRQIAFEFTDKKTGKSWHATPSDLGLRLDIDSTVDAALQVGRAPSIRDRLIQQAQANQSQYHLSPRVELDRIGGQRYLSFVAHEIDQPMINAGVVRSRGLWTTSPSQIGRALDIEGTYSLVQPSLTQLSGAKITFPITETLPQVSNEQAEVVLVDVKRIVSQPLHVGLPGKRFEEDKDIKHHTINTGMIEGMLRLGFVSDEEDPEYGAWLDHNQLRNWLEPFQTEVATEAVNARFVFNDDSGELEVLAKGIPARSLDITGTIKHVNRHAPTLNRDVPYALTWKEPTITEDATAESLGITELVAQGRSFFAGSSEVRVHNVATAASRFHGIVIMPGEEFSFNHYLGDVTEETGFEKGLIILGGRTIEGVGGGVCQVSTTAFQAAFYAGFPVLERYAHGYRVGYYEHGEGPGMDATVFSPVVDLKFVNDTDHHLLIEAYTNKKEQRLTFRFYSTSDGRKIEKGETVITDVKPHPPDLYEEDPELEQGEIEQVDWSADGAKVVIERIIRDAEDNIIRTDIFKSHYLPWQAIYHYGPGTEGMPPEDAVTPEPTPTPEP